MDYYVYGSVLKQMMMMMMMSIMEAKMSVLEGWHSHYDRGDAVDQYQMTECL